MGIDTPGPEEEEERRQGATWYASGTPGTDWEGTSPFPKQKPTQPSEASKQDASDKSSRKTSSSKHVPKVYSH